LLKGLKWNSPSILPLNGYNTPHLFREVHLQHLLGDLLLFWQGHTDPDGRNLGPVGDSSISLMVTPENQARCSSILTAMIFQRGWRLSTTYWRKWDFWVTLRETNIAMENGPCEDVVPIENEDIPASYVSSPEGNFQTAYSSSYLFKGNTINGLLLLVTFHGRWIPCSFAPSLQRFFVPKDGK